MSAKQRRKLKQAKEQVVTNDANSAPPRKGVRLAKRSKKKEAAPTKKTSKKDLDDDDEDRVDHRDKGKEKVRQTGRKAAAAPSTVRREEVKPPPTHKMTLRSKRK